MPEKSLRADRRKEKGEEAWLARAVGRAPGTAASVPVQRVGTAACRARELRTPAALVWRRGAAGGHSPWLHFDTRHAWLFCDTPFYDTRALRIAVLSGSAMPFSARSFGPRHGGPRKRQRRSWPGSKPGDAKGLCGFCVRRPAGAAWLQCGISVPSDNDAHFYKKKKHTTQLTRPCQLPSTARRLARFPCASAVLSISERKKIRKKIWATNQQISKVASWKDVA